MTWLLRLYPPAWRRRYGREVAEILAGRAFSFGGAIDLVAGAIDVWLHPSDTLAAATMGHTDAEEKTMLSRIARFECAASMGPGVTREDSLKSARVMIGGTLVLTALWTAGHLRFGDNTYWNALSAMPFFVSLLASMRFTYLKRRPASVQAIFIAGCSLILAAILLASGWLAARL